MLLIICSKMAGIFVRLKDVTMYLKCPYNMWNTVFLLPPDLMWTRLWAPLRKADHRRNLSFLKTIEKVVDRVSWMLVSDGLSIRVPGCRHVLIEIHPSGQIGQHPNARLKIVNVASFFQYFHRCKIRWPGCQAHQRVHRSVGTEEMLEGCCSYFL